jgi:hypothetical protein
LNVTVQGCFVDAQVLFPISTFSILNNAFEARLAFRWPSPMKRTGDNIFEKEIEMASRGPSLATAFIWAVSAAAGFGLVEGFINHGKRDQVVNDMGVAATAAAIAGYNERRRSPS